MDPHPKLLLIEDDPGIVAGLVSEPLEMGQARSAQSAIIGNSRAIQLAQGNQAKAARWLGVTRTTMREKLARLGLRPAGEKTEPSQ